MTMDASSELNSDVLVDILLSSSHRALKVSDGQGGGLALDLSQGEMGWLADACRRLLSGSIPRGASAIKVRASEKCYLLTRHIRDDSDELRIVNLFDPAEQVTLRCDVALAFVDVLESSATSKRPLGVA